MAERKNAFGGFTIYLSPTFGDNSPPLYAHTHTYTHIHTYTCTHIHVHRTCVYMCLSVCLYVCVCYVCVCIHVCVGVCSCHMNLIFMVNYTCRYFRDAILNICKCPSKDLSIEDTGWQSNCSFFQEELAYYKMSVMCVSMMYDYTYTCIGIHVYYTIIHNTFMLLK